MSTTMSGINIRISLPDDVAAAYEAQATKHNRSLEDELVAQLRQYKHIEATKPVVLNDVERQHLDKLMARNFNSGAELVSHVEHLLSISADGQEIPLSPQLLSKLKTRCHGMEFGKFMAFTVKRLLEEFVGMR